MTTTTANGANGHGAHNAGWWTLLRGRRAGPAAGAFARAYGAELPGWAAELAADMVHNVTSMRSEWFRQLGDPRRDVDDECGYPRMADRIGPELYRQLYDREPIANRVVQVLPKESWQSPPDVYEDEDADESTPFETALDAIEVNLGGQGTWHQDARGNTLKELLLRADVLSGLGHFGILLLGLDDGKNLQDPVDGVVVFDPAAPVPVKGLRKKKGPGGRPVRNAAGAWEAEEYLAGWRVPRRAARPVPPDSPPTPDEAAALDALVANGGLAGARPVFDKAGYREEPVTHPARCLNDWRPTPVANADPPRFTVKPDDRPQRGFGHGGNGPTTTARDVKGGAVYGTDRQYDQLPSGGYAYGTGPSGTEQQYFGPQFGVSEVLLGPGGALPGGETTGSGDGQPPAGAAGAPGPGGGKDKGSGRPRRRLVFLRAFDESLVQVVRYEWNVNNPRFGLPVMYRVTLNDPRETHSGVGLPLATVFVHWSRVIHLTDTFQTPGSSEVFSPPRLRPVLNRVLDCRKLYGASAEGYWKSCFAGISFETHPQLGGDVYVDEAATKDNLENYFNGLQRYLLGVGMTAKPLAPQVVDPGPFVAAQIEAICIQIGVPVRVFKGSERGELASSQDDASWNDRLRTRQNYYITPRIIVPFVDRLIALGVLPEPDGYTVEWPDLDSLTDTEKATVLLTRTQAYAAYQAGGLSQLIPPADYMTRFDDMSQREAQEIADAADEAAEQQDQENQDLADEHGFEPAPPPGFQAPAPEPPEPPGPEPVKLRGGEALVHPETGKTVAKGPPLPPPRGPAANANPEGCNQYKHCGGGAGAGPAVHWGNVELVPHSSWKDLPGEPGYVYHATNRDNGADITADRMVPHKPSYGTDQREWPDGSRESRNYFTASPATAYIFAPDHGEPALLRMRRPKGAVLRTESGTKDLYTKKAVPPHYLEVLTKSGWKNLGDMKQSPVGNAGPDDFTTVANAGSDRTEQKLRDLLDTYTDEEKDGLAVWYNPREQLVVVDRMGWYEKRGDADPATAVVELARDRVGFDQVEQQNEGGRPRPEDGWVTINAGVLDNAAGKGSGCGTGAGGFKPGNTCGFGRGQAAVVKRGAALLAVTRNAGGQWVDAAGRPAPDHVQKANIPPAWREVHVNPDPGGAVVATGVDAKGRPQARYSDAHAAKQAEAKFGRVRELLAKRQRIYQELAADARDPALKDRADCLGVVMRTGMRPGGTETGADYASYGATTLEGRHVVANKDGTVTLRLVTGKNKGREVEFPVRDPATAAMLKSRAKAAGPGGKLFDVSPAALRDYSLSKDGGGFKTKDHRTALGTETAVEALRGVPPPGNPKEYKARVKEIAVKVAATLGNTPAVALKSYIDPTVWAGWRQKAGV